MGVHVAADLAGAVLAVNHNTAVTVVHVKTGASVLLDHTADDRGQVLWVAVNAPGTLVATATGNKKVFLWNAQTGALVSSRDVAKRSACMTFVEAGSGGVATAPSMLVISDRNGDVSAYPVPELASGRREMFGHTASIISDLATSCDQQYIISCDRDEKIRVTALPYGHRIHAFCSGHTSMVTAIAVSPTFPGVVFSTSRDGSVAAWALASGELLGKYELPAAEKLREESKGEEADILTTGWPQGLTVCPGTSTVIVYLEQSPAVLMFRFAQDKPVGNQLELVSELSASGAVSGISAVASGQVVIVQEKQVQVCTVSTTVTDVHPSWAATLTANAEKLGLAAPVEPPTGGVKRRHEHQVL